MRQVAHNVRGGLQSKGSAANVGLVPAALPDGNIGEL